MLYRVSTELNHLNCFEGFEMNGEGYFRVKTQLFAF